MAVRIKTASYNNGGAAWNAAAEETHWIRYRLAHRMDEPASLEVVLSDPTGSLFQKYNVDANDVYIGPGGITLEDPVTDPITYTFSGRILRAEGAYRGKDRILTLYCEDWLSQLDELQIDYDMRETLNATTGQKESTLLPDWDQTDGVGGIRPAFDAGGGVIYLYDNHRILTADAWNGYKLMFTDGIAGRKTWKTGPYQKTTTAAVGIDTETGGAADMWDDDDANGYATIDNDESWTCDIDFRLQLGDETDTINNNYVAKSMTSARVIVTYFFNSTVVDDACDVQVYVDTNADGTLDTYKTIGQLRLSDNALGAIKEREVVFTIPEEMFNGTVGDAICSTGGIGRIRFNVTWGSGTTSLTIFKIYYEVSCATTGMSDIATIDTNLTYRITVDVDFADPTKKVWTGCPYVVMKEIYKHIESATGPVQGYDTMMALTVNAANVEDTSGVSSRVYTGKTPLTILKDLAIQDKAHFWVLAGDQSYNFYYKSTFNDAVADATLTDADVDGWGAKYDYQTLVNKCTVYGMQIGERRLVSTYSDAVSIAKYKQTRSKIVTDTGLTCEGDTLARATAIVNQYKDVLLKLEEVTIEGNIMSGSHAKHMHIGDEVQVTSTLLNLAAAWYIVQRIAYDSSSDVSTLTLHPRVSATGLQRIETPNYQRAMQDSRRGSADTYVADPGDGT